MDGLSFNDLVAQLGELRGKTVVTGHSLEDVDALASSVVLAELLGADARVIDRENAQAKRVSARLGVAVPPFGEALARLNQWDNLVLVDVCNSQMLGVLAPVLASFSGKVLAIDHHAHSNPLGCPHYVDESKASCSEIILAVSDSMGRRLGERQASLLALGVVSDTAFLKSAGTPAVAALARLLAMTPVDFSDMLQLLDVRNDAFERIASIAALQGASVERRGEAVVAFSTVRSHEHHAAESLVAVGADFAVVLNSASGKVTLLRSRNAAVSAIDCGLLARQVAEQFGGSGGGHPTVAGLAVDAARSLRAAETLLQKAKLLLPP